MISTSCPTASWTKAAGFIIGFLISMRLGESGGQIRQNPKYPKIHQMSSSCLVFVVVVVAVAVPVAVAVAAAAVVVVQQHQRRACGFNISVHKSVQASESSKQVVLIINHSNNLDVVLTIRSKWVAAIPHSTTIQSWGMLSDWICFNTHSLSCVLLVKSKSSTVKSPFRCVRTCYPKFHIPHDMY